MNKIIISDSFSPYFNLSLEEYLFDNYLSGTYLFLWQNDNTIVLGRNQNAYLECNLQKCEQNNVNIVRRKTGGGAVYHDRGNLNFTFICQKDNFNTEKQFSIIIDALKKLGIQANSSGRNDLVVGAKKISGNAFRHSKTASIHHGTILINTNLDALASLLTPSFEKLQSKGIKSVKSRVMNLIEIKPNLTIEILKNELVSSFIDIYGKAEFIDYSLFKDEIRELTNQYADKKFVLGENPKFDIAVDKYTVLGSFNFNLCVENNVIIGSKTYSDCLDYSFPEKIDAYLINTDFDDLKINLLKIGLDLN